MPLLKKLDSANLCGPLLMSSQEPRGAVVAAESTSPVNHEFCMFGEIIAHLACCVSGCITSCPHEY